MPVSLSGNRRTWSQIAIVVLTLQFAASLSSICSSKLQLEPQAWTSLLETLFIIYMQFVSLVQASVCLAIELSWTQTWLIALRGRAPCSLRKALSSRNLSLLEARPLQVSTVRKLTYIEDIPQPY